MSESTIGFVNRHLPGLPTGTTVVSASVTIEKLAAAGSPFHANDLRLFVSGPRFVLSPDDVFAVFPPRDSLGEFDDVLPHVELRTSTLPWLRASGASDPQPWLALVLLQEDEWTDPAIVVQEPTNWTALRDALGLATESTDIAQDEKKPLPPVPVLWIDAEHLGRILPTAADSRWLTHVREGGGAERAVVVANRLPRPGARASVHLVSLEGRYPATGELDLQKGRRPDDGKVPLLSLHSWQFSCAGGEQFKVTDHALGLLEPPLRTDVEALFPDDEARTRLYRGIAEFAAAIGSLDAANQPAVIDACRCPSETFKGLMDALDLGWFRLPHAGGQEPGMFRTGAVPTALNLRDGGRRPAWYHGPFQPAVDGVAEHGLADALPVRTADDLRLYDPATQMVDTSYAAAWQVGRLLSLADHDASRSIATWKASHAREAAAAGQNRWFSHIPFTDAEPAHLSDGRLADRLEQYFTDLSRLRGVPFHYLVPHESLLPHESLRFFHLDPLWIECLLDGAFSIGRTTARDRRREAGSSAARRPVDQPRPTVTGLLLRSDLVSGWPALVVEGHPGTDPDSAGPPLPVLRFERLGPTVLLVLFDGAPGSVAVHLPPGSLHFAFNATGTGATRYTKELKNLDTGDELSTTAKGTAKTLTLDLGWRTDERWRVVDVERLVRNMNANISRDTDQFRIEHSGHLAVELLEGSPRLWVTVSRVPKLSGGPASVPP